jgi:hypothetical protein
MAGTLAGALLARTWPPVSLPMHQHGGGATSHCPAMYPGRFIMGTTRVETITGSLSSLPSRRDVLRGLGSAGLVLTAVRDEDAAARMRHHKKRKHKPKQKAPLPPPPPLPFNEFGCLDIGQPCQGDSTLCCSGICDSDTSTCIGHNNGICFADTDPCTTGMPFPCSPNPNPTDVICSCTLTTGKAPFCASFTDLSDPTEFCRFCSLDTDCQEEFGPGAACVFLRGGCSSFCASTDRTACLRPCA